MLAAGAPPGPLSAGAKVQWKSGEASRQLTLVVRWAEGEPSMSGSPAGQGSRELLRRFELAGQEE